jgi:hypothetical protein
MLHAVKKECSVINSMTLAIFMQNGEKQKCRKYHSSVTQPTHYVWDYVNYNYTLPIPVAARSKA